MRGRRGCSGTWIVSAPRLCAYKSRWEGVGEMTIAANAGSSH